MSRLINVETKDNGKRIDLFMLEKELNMTRTSAKKLIMEGLIQVGGESVRPNFRIRPGQTIEYKVEESKKFIDSTGSTEIAATKMKLDIIYEDESIILVNKPAGLVVHPVYNHKNDTLLNGLTYYFQQKKESVKIRPVHRLDKETSGVILFTKNKDLNEYYSRLFEEHNVEKTYYAVVQGDFAAFMQHKKVFEYFSYISKDKTSDRAYFNTTKERGLPSRTRFFFEGYFKHPHNDRVYSIVKAQPLSGRTHQIRVHLSSLGFPILGDLIYSRNTYKRMMLHAYSLKLPLYEWRQNEAREGSNDPVLVSKQSQGASLVKSEERLFVAELPEEFNS